MPDSQQLSEPAADVTSATSGDGPSPNQQPAGFTAPHVVAVLVVSLIPFWLIPAAHVMSDPETATGLFHYELPYYVANGRSVFERGNGLSYPNPYDPAASSPSIYVHWLPWIFGVMTAKGGFDPGDVILTFTFFGSLTFAWATRRFVVHRVDSPQHRNFAFLAAMWGGGLLAVFGTIGCMVNGQNWLESVLRFDPGQGLWFLNWGRNALFPTEAIYHALVISCWLAEVRRHRFTANLCLVLLATTHPWSGLELLLTITVWRGVEFLRNGESVRQLVFSVGLLVVFLGYYKVWLPTFPQHAELQSVWELDWSVPWSSAAGAWLPMLIPVGVLLRRRMQRQMPDRTEQFLLCAVFVAAGLALHDRFVKPVQPIHFTRGYVWMPLFLLALPLLIEWWVVAQRKFRTTAAAASVCALLLIADNVVFSVVHVHRQLTACDGFHLDRHERTLLADLHNSDQAANFTVLTDSKTLNYLIPTYARLRPWLGHHFNTPSFPQREQTWNECFAGHDVRPSLVPDEVNLLVIRQSRNTSQLQADPAWVRMPPGNPEWHVWQRRSESAKDTITYNVHENVSRN